jgi:hypothetical protein
VVSWVAGVGLALTVGASVVLAGPASAGLSRPSAQEPIRRSAWLGAYTEPQARRGQRIYERACAHCHRPDLLGDTSEEIPPLAEDEFMRQWSPGPLSDLFLKITTTMPGDRPRSLSPAEFADVLAYILEFNKVPAGATELPFDSQRLGELTLEKR